ncbi:MAG TPA: glutamate-cysteine ligase family protein [Polyangiaceae bacterium]|jgi:glutamate--cysteine ligase|nr:glutamate-cysteine ligase family protein [Polyangiaceae bacterium]
MMPAAPEDDRAITRDDLEELFVSSEKPPTAWRIGGEMEKFGVDRETGAPLQYDGPKGVGRIFDELVKRHGWHPESETEGGPVIALTRGQASITLEPGAQLELSGAPLDDVHQVESEIRGHLDELASISAELGLAWLGVGFQPISPQSELPWVPKHRYGIMKRYLPTRGARGLDMMRRTSTVQANFDYSSEEDAMQKLVVMLRLSPVIQAMTANSPFIEGRVSSNKSERGAVWLEMDPSRSGLIPTLWESERPRYADYVEWALDAGMFLFKRNGVFVHNTGQTFRSFLKEGFDGYRATFADWALHVNTLFPEARLKRTLEARPCDCLPMRLVGSVPALFTGLVYDTESLGRAMELAMSLDLDAVTKARPELVAEGLDGAVGSVPARRIAAQIYEIAEAGLARRGREGRGGKDERAVLAPLGELVERGQCPADLLLTGLGVGEQVSRAELVRRCGI